MRGYRGLHRKGKKLHLKQPNSFSNGFKIPTCAVAFKWALIREKRATLWPELSSFIVRAKCVTAHSRINAFAPVDWL